MPEYQQLYDAIVKGDEKASVAHTQEALAGGADPEALVRAAMIPAMDEVGRRFEADEYFVPELMIAARAMKSSLAIVRPLLSEKATEMQGRVVIGTVQGDLHDIGKNLVASMLEGAGFEIVDLGADVSADQFVQAVKEKSAGIVALSALLTTTMPAVKTTIDALKDAGLRDQVRVMVGGAPLTQDYADQVGADGYGENARSAVMLARGFGKS